MRKIKAENKFTVSEELVDRIIDMHRGKVGTNVKEFKKEVIRRNEEFDKVAKAGNIEEAVKLRKETLDYVLDVDFKAIKSIMSDKPNQDDIRFKVARQKMILMNSIANKTIYEGNEVFDYLIRENNQTTEYGEIAEHIVFVEREGDKVEMATMCQTRLVFAAYIKYLINKEQPRTEKELETIEVIYRFLKGEEEDVTDMFEYVVADLEGLEVTEIANYGFTEGLFTEQLIYDTVAGASVAINTFSTKNPLLQHVRTARTQLREMFEKLNLSEDTFEDVVGEVLSLKDKIKDAASLQEHLNTSRMVTAVYNSKFRQNIMIAKGMNHKDRVSAQVLDTNVTYVEYGLLKVLDAIMYCVCEGKLNTKAVLACIIFNLITIRIKSDRDICRGTEILAKDMETLYCSDEWELLATKIMDYVKDFDVPDFDASVYDSAKVEVK